MLKFTIYNWSMGSFDNCIYYIFVMFNPPCCFILICEVLVHIFIIKGTQLSDCKKGELGPNLDNRLFLPRFELNTVLLSCECDRHLALYLQPVTQLHGRHLSFGLDWGIGGQCSYRLAIFSLVCTIPSLTLDVDEYIEVIQISTAPDVKVESPFQARASVLESTMVSFTFCSMSQFKRELLPVTTISKLLSPMSGNFHFREDAM